MKFMLQFMPWKKTYHRLKKGEQDAVHTMQQIVQTEDMVKPSLRLVNLIRLVRSCFAHKYVSDDIEFLLLWLFRYYEPFAKYKSDYVDELLMWLI